MRWIGNYGGRVRKGRKEEIFFSFCSEGKRERRTGGILGPGSLVMRWTGWLGGEESCDWDVAVILIGCDILFQDLSPGFFYV